MSIIIFFSREKKKKISEILMLGNSVKKYSLEENMNLIPSTVFPLRRNARFWSLKSAKINSCLCSLTPSKMDIPNNTMKSSKHYCV